VVASKTGDGVALLSFDGHRGDDNNVYVFATNDYGESWKAIRNGIPDSAGSVHSCASTRVTTTSYSGNELGCGYPGIADKLDSAEKQFPDGASGRHRIQARENDLVLATHGRSIGYLMT